MQWEWPFIIGQAVAQGARTDIQTLLAAVKSGKTDKQIWDDEEMGGVHGSLLRMHKSVAYYRSVVLPPEAQLQDVRVLWGAPGTGKTRYVYDNHDATDIYNATLASKGWFDGYAGQKVILFDDPDFSTIPITSLLNWLDRYPISLPVKGSSVARRSEIIYLTHNHPLEEWYPAASSAHQAALKRRVTTFHHFATLPTNQ